MMSLFARAALMFSVSLLTSTGTANAGPLKRFAWEARPIVIFAPRADDPRLVRQTQLFATRRAAMIDRETPLIVAAGATASIDGAPSKLSAAALRRAYSVPQDAFAVLLIGKDTGVKLRSRDIVRPEEIFALIDGMPMRRREMRECR